MHVLQRMGHSRQRYDHCRTQAEMAFDPVALGFLEAAADAIAVHATGTPSAAVRRVGLRMPCPGRVS